MIYAETRRKTCIEYNELYDDLHVIVKLNTAQFITINNVDLNIFDINQTTISWSIQDTVLDPNLFSFHVERSGSPEGPFERLTPSGLNNTFAYTDRTAPNFGKLRRAYYRVGTLKNATREITYTKPRTYHEKPDYVGLEIARRYKLLLEKEVGVSCIIYKRRRWGKRCLDCWDEKMNRRTRTKCLNCFDTGYEGGYWSSIPVMVNFSPSQLVIQQTPWGRVEPSALTAWMGNYPLVEPEDIIIELTGNKRWVIKNIANTEKKRSPLKQVMQIEELDKGRVEYRLEI